MYFKGKEVEMIIPILIKEGIRQRIKILKKTKLKNLSTNYVRLRYPKTLKVLREVMKHAKFIDGLEGK
jgi:hypothetical protein